MKKITLCMVILIFVSGIAFSQQYESDQFNTLGLHLNLIGAGAAFNYERSFNPNFSLLGEISLDIIPVAFTLAAKARYYPFGRAFYLEMGAGYGMTIGYVGLIAGYANLIAEMFTFGLADTNWDVWMHGVVLTPGLGWKIDLGKPGGFTLPIGLGINIFLGPREISPVDFTFNTRIGAGFSF